MLSPTEAFEAWAPPDAPWSPWAKPVLFAQEIDFSAPLVSAELGEISFPWLAELGRSVAFVIDLPGPTSIAAGLALAGRGFRPVPLFNTSAGPSPVLDVATLQRQLFDEAEGMNALGLPRAAPPAFLLDAQRLEGHRPSRPGTFDNRWVVFPQDFPSGAKLRAAGIARVVVWQESDGEPKDDLAHVLLRWQEANIEISIKSRAPESRPARTEISRPSWFRSALQRVFVAAGLRPNSAGGFGAPIPMPSSSTYG